MANTIKYVRKRGSVYYYERRVPQTVIDKPAEFDAYFGGKQLFRRSLKTKRQTEALMAAREMEEKFDKRVSQALGILSKVSTVASPRRPVTPFMIEKIARRYQDETAKPFRLSATLRERDHEFFSEELERMRSDLEMDADMIRRVLIDAEPSTDPKLDIFDMADVLIQFEGLDAPKGSDARLLVQRAIRDGILAGYRHVTDMFEGRQPWLPSAAQRAQSTAPLFGEIVENYVASLTKRRTITEVRTAYREFEQLIGNLSVDELTKEHFIRYCRNQGSKHIGGKSKGSVARPMSIGNLRKKHGLLRAAINHAIKQGLFDGANPAAGVDASAFASPAPAQAMPEKRPFEISELNRIFSYPWFTGCEAATRIHDPGYFRLSGMHFWGPIMALFTGCRAGELGGLMVNEVRLNSQYPHIEIRDNKFRSTKGSYRRKIPLLDQLLELGFASYVEQAQKAGHERLFADWNPPSGRSETDDPAWSNGAMVRSFNQTLIPKALDGLLMPGARREVTFHSFRGAFKRLLGLQKYGIQTNYIHEVVGHEKFHLDKRYIKEIPLEETYPAIRACRYENLHLPMAP